MDLIGPYNTGIEGLIPTCVNIVTRTLYYLKIDRDPNEVFADVLFSVTGNRTVTENILDERVVFEAIIRWSETMFMADAVNDSRNK